MSTSLNLSRTLAFVAIVLVSANCQAWHGGGYYHGGGYHHGGYYHSGYYHGGYYRGGYYGSGWGWGGGGIAIGVPLGVYGASYYAPTCYNQRICNYHGCWLQRRCY